LDKILVKNKRIPILSLISIGFLPSFLKKWVYRLKGYKIGKGVTIGFGSVIIGKSVTIKKGTKIDFFTFIICEECSIDRDVKIGSFVYFKVDKISIGYQTVIRENNLFGGMDIGKSELSIGNMSHVHQKCMINTTLPVRIGSYTAIGGGSYLFTHSSWQSMLEGYPCTFAPITIGDNVWVSWNVFILPSVEIGSGTLVSAGAIVSKSLPEKCLASGNPAKAVIPSGMFPREPHPDERTEMVINIVSDFADFLIKKGLGVVNNNNEDCKEYTITDLKKKKHKIYLFEAKSIDISGLELNESSVILSVQDISEVIDKSLRDMKSSFVNIEKGTVYSTNSLCSELKKYLKHYGIQLVNI
jgi:acetyltransferase-like isoleucine patch superfamily enzyme